MSLSSLSFPFPDSLHSMFSYPPNTPTSSSAAAAAGHYPGHGQSGDAAGAPSPSPLLGYAAAAAAAHAHSTYGAQTGASAASAASSHQDYEGRSGADQGSNSGTYPAAAAAFASFQSSLKLKKKVRSRIKRRAFSIGEYSHVVPPSFF